MKKAILVAAAVAMMPATIALTTIWAQQSTKEIVSVTPRTSAVVHAILLQGRAAAGAFVRRLKSRRSVG